MLIFKYKGTSVDNEIVKGTIDAKNSSHALRILQKRQISIFELKQFQEKTKKLKTSRPKGADYYQLIQQMSVLLSAGIPLLETLDSLKSNVEHEQLVSDLTALETNLREGGSLSEGFRLCLPQLPPSVPVLIGLGERTGELAKVLGILAEQLGFREELRSDLKSALSYPIFLLLVGIIAVGFLFGFVVPRFSKMLGDKRESLEGVSKIVFVISDGLKVNAVPLSVLGIGLIGLSVFISQNRKAKDKSFELFQRLPGIGTWFRQIEIANWTRLVAVSLLSKADLLESVSLARYAVRSPRNRAAFDNVARDLRSGVPLGDALNKVPDLEPVVLNLVKTGSKAGKLGPMMMLATEILDKRVRGTAERFGKLAEPIAILFISALVGVVVISLVTAMTSLYDVGFV